MDAAFTTNAQILIWSGMAFSWTPTAKRVLLWWTLDGKDAAAIAASLGCKRCTVESKQTELKLRQRRKRLRLTEEEKAIMWREYADTATAEIARKLHRSVHEIHQAANRLGVTKSREFLSAMAREKLYAAGMRHRFKPGSAPWNKGLHHPKGWAPGRMAETQFKKGERNGQAARNWRPIGTISIDDEGFRRIKLRDALANEPYGFGNSKAWPLLHHWTWERRHGPVPAGHKIAFKDRNRGNCELENLELVSDAEMMRRNSVHNRPQELALVIQLAGALHKKLRAYEKRPGNTV